MLHKSKQILVCLKSIEGHTNLGKLYRNENNFQEITHVRMFTYSQFHQHYTGSFFSDFFPPKKLQTQTVNKKKLHKTLFFYKKLLVKCWRNRPPYQIKAAQG